MTEARGSGNTLREKSAQPAIAQREMLLFQIEGEMKTFSRTQTPEFMLLPLDFAVAGGSQLLLDLPL